MKKARHLLIASMVLMLLLLTRVSALASITVTVIPNIPKVDANTGSTHQYSNHWQYWSQGASAYPDNTSSGLRNMRRRRVSCWSRPAWLPPMCLSLTRISTSRGLLKTVIKTIRPMRMLPLAPV